VVRCESSGGAAAAAQRGIIPRVGLFETLTGAARVTHVSAPAGSGKTSLLRSWIREARLADRVAWVAVEPKEHDPQRFWLSVLNALRTTVSGSELVRAVSAAPELDTAALTERLLQDLDLLEQPLWLVLDDLHELDSRQAMRELELVLMRAPADLRFVLLTRHDLSLGLHRLRLEGGLSELRTDDLRFELDESRALLEGSGVQLSEQALALLQERTEGWAAGSAWQLCRWAATQTRSASPRSSPAANGRWPSTCSPRCSSANRTKYGDSCCAPRCSTE